MFIQQTGRARHVYQEMRMEHRQDGNRRKFPLSTTSLLSTRDKLAIWSDYAWHHATQFRREKANRMHVLCISSLFFLSHLKAFVFIQQTRVPTLCPAAPQAPGGLGCICEEDLTSQSYFPTHQMLPRMLGTPSFSLGSRFKIILNQGTSLVAQRLRICFPMRQGQV